MLIEKRAGGYFSSTNDFATIGKSILNSTLISAARTRRWLKPSSFVNGLNLGVGRPWEINRFQNDDNHTVDIYTKAGDCKCFSPSSLTFIDQYQGALTTPSSRSFRTTPSASRSSQPSTQAAASKATFASALQTRSSILSSQPSIPSPNHKQPPNSQAHTPPLPPILP